MKTWIRKAVLVVLAVASGAVRADAAFSIRRVGGALEISPAPAAVPADELVGALDASSIGNLAMADVQALGLLPSEVERFPAVAAQLQALEARQAREEAPRAAGETELPPPSPAGAKERKSAPLKDSSEGRPAEDGQAAEELAEVVRPAARVLGNLRADANVGSIAGGGDAAGALDGLYQAAHLAGLLPFKDLHDLAPWAGGTLLSGGLGPGVVGQDAALTLAREWATQRFWRGPVLKLLAAAGGAGHGAAAAELEVLRGQGPDAGPIANRRRAAERHSEELFGSFERAFYGERAEGYPESAARFRGYIREATDVLALSAPSDREEEVVAHARAKLATLGQLLVPLIGNGVVEIDQQGERQVFLEYLQTLLFPGFRMEFNVGLGGFGQVPSVRLLTYVIPALKQLRAWKAVGARNSPRLRIFHGHEISTEVNALNAGRARENAGMSLHFLKAFIDEFYPEVAGLVDYDMPSAQDLSRKAYAGNMAIVRAFEAKHMNGTPLASGSADENLTRFGVSTPDLIEARASLRRQASNHAAGGPETWGGYAAYHPVLFRQLVEGADRALHGVVMFIGGGNGADAFATVMRWLARHYGDPRGDVVAVNTSFGFTDAGSVRANPIFAKQKNIGTNRPYYPLEGELLLDQLGPGLRFKTSQELLAHYKRSRGNVRNRQGVAVDLTPEIRLLIRSANGEDGENDRLIEFLRGYEAPAP